MAITVKSNGDGGGGNYEPCPAGNHAARCYAIADLGTQQDEVPGYGTKVRRRVMIFWELPEELHQFKEENGLEPYVVSKEFTMSLGDKSSLKPYLEQWRGKAFSEDELQGFDITKLIGAPCMLNITHKPKGEKVSVIVGSATPLPKSLKCPPQINPRIEVSLDSKEEFDSTMFGSLPEWVQKKIILSPEYKQVTSGGDAGYAPIESQETPAIEDADDLPF
jgi:hypothetical protein